MYAVSVRQEHERRAVTAAISAAKRSDIARDTRAAAKRNGTTTSLGARLYPVLRLARAPFSLSRSVMKSILVPIDCSNATPRVLDLARQMARALSAEIHLLHVREMLPAMPPSVVGYGVAGMAELMPMSSNPIPVLDPMPQPAPVNESDKTKLNEWQKQIAQDGVKATLSEPTGPIVEEILREADAINADLIVMGRHGHGAMYNLLVGSVTEGVLKRSARPVLLVPSPKS